MSFSSDEHQRFIFVGDIHGCLEELDALLRECDYSATRDRLFLVGDLVAKGPDSVGVVRRAMELCNSGATCVLGNHDDELLKIRTRLGDGEPESAMKAEHLGIFRQLSPSEIAWIENLPLYVRVPEVNAIVVHAGLVPEVPLQEQARWDVTCLRNIHYEDGKAVARELDGDGVAWIQTWHGPETVIFGHDATRGLQVAASAVGLDTGACYGGHLTALVLPDHRFVAVRAKQTYTQPKKAFQPSPDFIRLRDDGGLIERVCEPKKEVKKRGKKSRKAKDTPAVATSQPAAHALSPPPSAPTTQSPDVLAPSLSRRAHAPEAISHHRDVLLASADADAKLAVAGNPDTLVHTRRAARAAGDAERAARRAQRALRVARDAAANGNLRDAHAAASEGEAAWRLATAAWAESEGAAAAAVLAAEEVPGTWHDTKGAALAAKGDAAFAHSAEQVAEQAALKALELAEGMGEHLQPSLDGATPAPATPADFAQGSDIEHEAQAAYWKWGAFAVATVFVFLHKLRFS